MTDDENRPSENGSAAGKARNESTTGFEHDSSLEVGSDRILKLAGVVVFVLSAIAGLLFLLVGSWLPVEDWLRLRTVELFAMLAAIGIVVAILASRYSNFSMTFGILLIGALIVPTKDMVSLALLATGQDPQNQSDFDRASDGSEFKGRDSDVAEKIITRLQRTPKVEGGSLGEGQTVLPTLLPEARNLAKLAITDTLNSDRKVTHLERVRYSGSLGLLLSFSDTGESGGYREYYYRYGNTPGFVKDLQALRSQELIRFSYNDFTEADITYLGKDVLCDYFETFESKSCPFPDVNRERDSLGRQLSDFSFSLDRRAIELCETTWQSFSELSIPIEEDTLVIVPYGAKFTIEAYSQIDPVRTDILAQLLQSEEGEGDPYLFLLTRGANGRCSVLESNDDSDFNTLNSEIRNPLGTGTFLILALDLASEGVEHRLKINFPY